MIIVSRFRDRLVDLLQPAKGASFHDAEDAVSGVFLDLWRKALTKKLEFRARGFYTYLFKASCNRYWRIRRSRKENAQPSRARESERVDRTRKRLPALLIRSDAGIEDIDSGCTPVPDTASKRQKLRLLDFVAARELTRKQRIVLIARRENLKFKHAAELAGTTEGAARQDYAKAIKTIRMTLGRAA